MDPDSGRHNSDDNSSDRARINFLAGDGDVDLDPAERAELDELNALLADPTLWVEPPASLEDSVAAMIAAEVAASADATTVVPGAVHWGAVDSGASGPVASRSGDAAPTDLAAARQAKQAKQDDRRRRFTRPTFLVAAAAAVVAVALSAVLLLSNTPPRHFDVALAATDLAPGAAGSATMLKTDSGWAIHLDASGLPRLDGGRYYQAWLRNAAGVLVPIGSFNEGADVTLWAGVSPQDFATMTITREVADGAQDSSGQRVLVGTAVEK